ncbi:MAG: hypothetical protein KF883_02300 [Thermomicrobiales bacterium]|nr:hypothetical protein [Thermomicrobiales bacterium]
MHSGRPVDRLATPGGPRSWRSPIGRDAEIASLAALILDPAVSLVTVTGPGGVGKTTLAAHVSRLVEASFPGGVDVVPLAQVAETGYLFHAIAQRLDIRETGQTAVGDQLIERFRERPALLVLDTFEHLLDEAPEVAWLVAACPELTCLITSRSPLRLREEREFPLKPLLLSGESTDAAVSLFEERAKAVAPAFTLTPENAGDVAAICRRLDGLPLAIELAAARIRHLPPGVMLRKLDDPLSLLASGARDAPDRQRTMRGTIAWSYDLLDPEAQRLFRLLSVFRGSFALDAVEAMAEDLPATDVLETLSVLLDHSLVELAGAGAEARYRLLDTVREFGLELLDQADERLATQEKHAIWFRDLAERSATFWWGPDHFEWLERIERDIDNLRQALSWFESSGDIESAARLATAMYGIWRVHGPVSEGWSRSQRIVSMSESLPEAIRAKLHLCLAGLEWVFAEQSSSSLDQMGYQLAIKSGDDDAIAFALVYRGATSETTGELDRAQAALWELVEMGRTALPGQFAYQWMAAGLEHLASIERDLGNIEQARALARDAVEVAAARGFAWGYPMIVATLADIERIAGLRSAAAGHFREAITIVWPQRQPRHAAAILAGYAALAADEGSSEIAARLAGAADRLVQSDGVILPAYVRRGYAALLERARAELGVQALEENLDIGRSWSSDEARDAALDSMATLDATISRPARSRLSNPLSSRETEVLTLVVAGKTDAEIAEMLFISRSTAGDHVSNILAKFDVPNRVSAAVFAIRNGLV